MVRRERILRGLPEPSMHVAHQLLAHRHLILRRTRADLRHRYAGTGLGAVWNVLHPLSLVAVYSLIFGLLLQREMKHLPDDVPFAVYICSGLLPWLAFTECLAKGAGAFRSNAVYLKKLPVPESVYVAQIAITAGINAVIGLTILLGLALVLGVPVGWTWLLLPGPLVLLLVLGFGLGLLAGTLNVIFPDLGQAIPVVLRIGMWSVPIILPLWFYDQHGLGGVVACMPPTGAIEAIHELLVFGRMPPTWTWIAMTLWAVAAAWLGSFALRRLRSDIRDLL